jgi:HEAT repeat protein
MTEALKVFLDSIAAGDDARTEEAALAVGRLGDVPLSALRDLLQDPDPDRRWWAARALAAVGTKGARMLLIAALSDPDTDVQACAAQGLGELQAEEAVPQLARCMATPSSFVSRIASDSLARIGRPAVPALIAALKEGEAPARSGAARALRIIQPQEAVPALCAALDDPSAVVTHYAEEALERMGVGLVLFRP